MLQEKFHPSIHFDIMINFDFSLTYNLGSPHDISVKFGFGRFTSFEKSRKILASGCPT